jgi:TRAP-type C4-dicarboxylate transport system permease small subunit
VLVFQAMVAWFAWRTARFAALFETPVLSWPEWVFYAPVAIGCADIVITEAIFLVWQLRRVELPASQGHGVLS